LFSSRRQFLNLSEKRRTTERWQGLGLSAGPALIGQSEKETPCMWWYNLGICTVMLVLCF